MSRGRSTARAGLLALTAVACASHATAPQTGPLSGAWAGPEAALTVDADGARLELVCADGRIDGPPDDRTFGPLELVRDRAPTFPRCQ